MSQLVDYFAVSGLHIESLEKELAAGMFIAIEFSDIIQMVG